MEKLNEDNADINPLLEYMREIATIYAPDVDFDSNTEERYVYGTSAYHPFIYRYNHNQLFGNISYENYLANKEIQGTLQLLEIDPEKFWFLLLFVVDYTSDICLNGIQLDGTGLDQLTLLAQAIEQNIKDINWHGVTFDKNTTLSLKIEGKHQTIINNPNAIGYLCYIINNNLKEIQQHPWMQIQKIDFKRPKEEKDSTQIWLFNKMFKDFFQLPQYKKQFSKRAPKGSAVSSNKTLLISRLIYFSKISTNENFQIDEDTLKGYIKQYKNKKINTTGKIYM